MFDIHAFPWTNFHDPNLNWIISEMKRIEEYLAGADVDRPDIEKRLQNVMAVMGNSGPGLLRLKLTSETDMTLVDPTCYRTKNDSTLHISVNFRNSTAEAIAADTELISFDHITIDTAEADPGHPRTANLWGVTAFFCASDGTVTAHNPYIKYITGDKTYLCIDHGIPVGTRVVIVGEAPLSVTKNELILREKFPERLANEICYTFLHGVPGNTWHEGEFDYSNSASTRLDETARATDCSGMIYIAYHIHDLRPSRSSVATSYSNDGMVISWAERNVPLDLTYARAGDIICFHRLGDPTRIPHCMLYAGNGVAYEMSAHYTEAEHDNGAVDGQGPYQLVTPAAIYKMDQYDARSVVRFL